MDVQTKNDDRLQNYVLNYAVFYNLQVDDLCLCNDFATTFIVDVFYDIVTFKFNPRTAPGFTLDAVPKVVKTLVREYLSLFRAGHAHFFKKIMTHASHFADRCSFENDQLRLAALQYVELYLHTFHRNSSFVIEPSNHHYQNEGHLTSLRITATKDVRAGCGVSDLLMFTKYTRNVPRRWENYSIHGHYVGVGPLMYANHSCLNNGEYISHWTSDNRLRFIWVSSLSIQKSNEITVNYGSEYFDGMRCECEKCRPWFA